MAAALPMSSLSEPNPDSVPTPSAKVPRRPLPLSANQEQQVRDLYYKNVRGMCAEEIKAFAACADTRTISATWACRTPRTLMNNCMVAHATQENMDAARTQWFSEWKQRRKQKELDEVRKEEARKFHREYWGLDEQGRRRQDVVDEVGDERRARDLVERERRLGELGVSLEGKKRR